MSARRPSSPRRGLLALALLSCQGTLAAAGDNCDRDCRWQRAEALRAATGRARQATLGGELGIRWSAEGDYACYSLPADNGEAQHFRVDVETLEHGPVTTDRCPTEQNSTAPPGHAVSPDGRYAVFSRDHNLYVAPAIGDRKGRESPLTSDGELWYSYAGYLAKSHPADQRPTGPVAPRLAWIGDGPYFFLERWDQRAVGTVWQIDSLSRPRPQLITQKMPFPGDAELPVPEIRVFNAARGTGVTIAADGWAYLGNMDLGGGGIKASRDGRALLFTRMNRDYSVVELCRADIDTGRVKVVLREERQPYSTVRYPEFYELEQGYLWKSDRSGYHHYDLYDTQGARRRAATAGAFSVARILHIDERAGQIWFEGYGDAAVERPRARHVYRADIDTGAVRRLDDDRAHHRAFFAPGGRHYLDLYSTPDTPPTLELKHRDGNRLRVLASGSDAGLRQLGWHPPEPFTVTAADGTTPLYGLMWRPSDFNPRRHYPLIAEVYPGPAKEYLPAGFSASLDQSALAELGFVVINLGQRGSSPIRGSDYARYARQQGSVRDYPLADHRAALLQLAARHDFIDPGRVGVYGHSGGGFMAVAAMLAYPDLYRAGMASAGNHDNRIYEMNSSTYYFGRPGSSDAARYTSTIDNAGNLQGPLLLVHGDRDQDVNLAHTLRLVDALIDADKPFDLLVLPGEGHGYSAAAERYVSHRLWRHFLEHL